MAFVHDLYDSQATATPHALACVCHGPSTPRVECTYAELVERSCVLATHLSGTVDNIQTTTAHLCSTAAKQAGAKTVVAVLVPRVHKDFLPLVVALSRCGVTAAFMSTDLRDKDLEHTRNTLIVSELGPCLLVATSSNIPDAEDLARHGNMRVLSLEELSTGRPPGSATQSNALSAATTPFSFLFTGGTTRGRCVAVTHAMFAHERVRYQDCLRLSPPVRVLANTSVYWGASALGQLSIALAYGGCAILCEANEADELREVTEAETPDVFGLVPDQLRTLAERPAQELPNVRAIFTWGERLPAVVAEAWRGHPRAQLRELLISTEYWLAFYAAPLQDDSRLLRIVPDTKILVLVIESDDGNTGATGSGNPVERPAVEGEVGELLLAGPMVTSGYVALSASASGVTGAEPTPFKTIAGIRYFCTRDLVRLGSGGCLEFRGRADMTTKEKGKWIDLIAIEEEIQNLPGGWVREAAVLPDGNGVEGVTAHAFVVLWEGDVNAIPPTLMAVRTALPRNAQVHVLHVLPRHPVTRKVDLRRLRAIVAESDARTWPLQPDKPAPDYVVERARAQLRSHCRWTLAAACGACLWDLQALLAVVPVVLRPLQTQNSPPLKLPALPRAWTAECAPRLSGLGFLLLPYMHLATLHFIDRWQLLRSACSVVPLGMWGAMFAALSSRGVATPRSFPWCACTGLATSWAVIGVGLAAWRGRLQSYPIAFWMGIGCRLNYDCEVWLHSWYWKRHFRWLSWLILQQCQRCLPSWMKSSETDAFDEGDSPYENRVPAEAHMRAESPDELLP